jgi:hypothetical protein
MSYAYIKQHYGLEFEPGDRVTHTVTQKAGQVTREDLSQSHYVQVRFDDRKFSVPCHPQELEKVTK